MRVILLLLAPFLVASAALAAPRPMPVFLKADASEFHDLTGEARSKTIARIEEYLTGISTLTAEFSQTSSDGSAGDGIFYMKRPGKVRWQYHPPTNLLLVSNGRTLTYYDPQVKQVTYVGVDETLASFVAQKTIQLDGPASRLTQLQSNDDGVIRAALIQRKKPDEGSMTLEFTDKPLKISRMITIDATGNETQVALSNQKFGMALEDKLFVFNDPRGVNDKRNRKR